MLEYASDDQVIREALITCDDPKEAAQMRSFGDEDRTLTGTGLGEERRVALSFGESYPSPPKTVTVTVPIVNDDLDLAHAKLPPRIHIGAFKR